MAKTKLVSLNMGISLIVLKNGKEEKMSYSLRCPSKSFDTPLDAIRSMCDFIGEEFGIGIYVNTEQTIPVAKPKAIKAPAPVSQDEFNKRIKELVS